MANQSSTTKVKKPSEMNGQPSEVLNDDVNDGAAVNIDSSLGNVRDSIEDKLTALATILPAVFLMLGGTGTQIAQYIMQFLDQLGISDWPDTIKIRVLDADASRFEEFPPDKAATYHAKGPALKILHAMRGRSDEYNHLRGQIGDPEHIIPLIGTTDSMDEGTEAVRPIAVVLFVFQLINGWLPKWLLQPVRELNAKLWLNRDQTESGLPATSLKKQNKPKTVTWAVGSAYGGWGSAIVQPVSQEIRKLLAEEELNNFWLYGLILLGGGEEVADQIRLNAHIMALLMEIELHASGQALQHTWQYGPHKIENPNLPFHRCFVLDKRNLDKFSFSGKQVKERAALGMRLFTVGRLATAFTSNVQNVIGKQKDPLSSFGAFELEIPVPKIIRSFALKLGRDITGIHLLRQQPAEEASKAAKQQQRTFVKQTSLRQADMERIFRTQPDGRDMEIFLEHLRQTYKGPALEQAIAVYSKSQLDKYAQVLNGKTALETKKFQRQLDQQLERLINAPDGGIVQAQYFLEALSEYLQRLADPATRELSRAQSHLEEHRQKMAESSATAIEQSLLSRLAAAAVIRKLGRSDKKVLEQKEIEANLNLAVIQQSKRLTWLEQELQTLVDNRLRYVSQTHSRLENLAEQLKQQEINYAHQRRVEQPSCIRNVLSDQEEADLYAAKRDQAWSQVVAGLRVTLMTDQDQFEAQLQLDRHAANSIDLHNVDELHRRLVVRCQIPWQSLQDELQIETILSNQDPAWLLEYLKDLSKPMVALRELEQGKMPTPEIMLGTPNGRDGLFKNTSNEEGLSIYQTNDPHRISMLQVIHGIKPSAIVGYEGWLRAYHELRQAGYPLHVFPVAKNETLDSANDNGGI